MNPHRPQIWRAYFLMNEIASKLKEGANMYVVFRIGKYTGFFCKKVIYKMEVLDCSKKTFLQKNVHTTCGCAEGPRKFHEPATTVLSLLKLRI